MKKLKNYAKVGMAGGVASLALASQASAQVTLPTSLDIGPVETLAGLIIAGLSTMWGIRKIIKTVNRS